MSSSAASAFPRYATFWSTAHPFAPSAQVDAELCARFRAAVLALKPRLDMECANRISEHPWLADPLSWRARHGERIPRRMTGVLEETANRGNQISLREITRLFLPIR